MQVKSILHRVQRHQGFVYAKMELVEENEQLALNVTLEPRRNSRAVCSGCGQKRPGYDTLSSRRFEFLPFWGILVYFIYAMRRVECPTCGIKVERVPWAEGKRTVTTAYAWFLARWAKQLSWAQVAEAFHTSWYTVYRAVEMAVSWGRGHMDLSGITAIGIDEMAWGRGHRYVTVVYQIDRGCKRLLWLGAERKTKTLLRFFRWFGPERTAELRYVCSDMWRPYLKVVAKKASQAIHILDRFHIVSHLNKAIDQVRAAEAKELARQGYEPVLKQTRWLLLKRPEHLTAKQVDDAGLVRGGEPTSLRLGRDLWIGNGRLGDAVVGSSVRLTSATRRLGSLRSQQPLVLCLIHDIQHTHHLLALYSNCRQGTVSLSLTQRASQVYRKRSWPIHS